MIYSGTAYYEHESIGTAEGFVSVDSEDGITIEAYAYDQGEDATPCSVSVDLTREQARKLALDILKKCGS